MGFGMAISILAVLLTSRTARLLRRFVRLALGRSSTASVSSSQDRTRVRRMITPLYQNNPAFNDQIQKYGCLFFCYLHAATMITREQWTVDSIEQKYIEYVHNGWLLPNCNVKKPDRIMIDCGVELNGWIRFESVGYRPTTYEQEILLFKAPLHKHFVLGNNKTDVLYDPLVASNTVRNGSLIRKTIIRTKEKVFNHDIFAR